MYGLNFNKLMWQLCSCQIFVEHIHSFFIHQLKVHIEISWFSSEKTFICIFLQIPLEWSNAMQLIDFQVSKILFSMIASMINGNVRYMLTYFNFKTF